MLKPETVGHVYLFWGILASLLGAAMGSASKKKERDAADARALEEKFAKESANKKPIRGNNLLGSSQQMIAQGNAQPGQPAQQGATGGAIGGGATGSTQVPSGVIPSNQQPAGSNAGLLIDYINKAQSPVTETPVDNWHPPMALPADSGQMSDIFGTGRDPFGGGIGGAAAGSGALDSAAGFLGAAAGGTLKSEIIKSIFSKLFM